MINIKAILADPAKMKENGVTSFKSYPLAKNSLKQHTTPTVISLWPDKTYHVSGVLIAKALFNAGHEYRYSTFN